MFFRTGRPAASDGEYLGANEPETPKAEPAESADALLKRIPADMPGTRDPNAKTFKAWANYACAYRARYRTWPVWNQKTAGQMSQLVDRVGATLAPKVAAFYLQMNHQFYLSKVHPVSLLLADCEAIATQCTTGVQVTQAQARQVDSTQSNLSNFEQAKACFGSAVLNRRVPHVTNRRTARGSAGTRLRHGRSAGAGNARLCGVLIAEDLSVYPFGEIRSALAAAVPSYTAS